MPASSSAYCSLPILNIPTSSRRTVHASTRAWLSSSPFRSAAVARLNFGRRSPNRFIRSNRSEEHTSELQSRSDLVCRLLLEKKKKIKTTHPIYRNYTNIHEYSCFP